MKFFCCGPLMILAAACGLFLSGEGAHAFTITAYVCRGYGYTEVKNKKLWDAEKLGPVSLPPVESIKIDREEGTTAKDQVFAALKRLSAIDPEYSQFLLSRYEKVVREFSPLPEGVALRGWLGDPGFGFPKGCTLEAIAETENRFYDQELVGKFSSRTDEAAFFLQLANGGGFRDNLLPCLFSSECWSGLSVARPEIPRDRDLMTCQNKYVEFVIFSNELGVKFTAPPLEEFSTAKGFSVVVNKVMGKAVPYPRTATFYAIKDDVEDDQSFRLRGWNRAEFSKFSEFVGFPDSSLRFLINVNVDGTIKKAELYSLGIGSSIFDSRDPGGVEPLNCVIQPTNETLP